MIFFQVQVLIYAHLKWLSKLISRCGWPDGQWLPNYLWLCAPRNFPTEMKTIFLNLNFSLCHSHALLNFYSSCCRMRPAFLSVSSFLQWTDIPRLSSLSMHSVPYNYSSLYFSKTQNLAYGGNLTRPVVPSKHKLFAVTLDSCADFTRI